MSIGNRIIALRKELQLSQEDMADKIGVSRQSVSKWETDVCAPDAYNLIALAEALNTSVEYIVTGKTSVENTNTPQTKPNTTNNNNLTIIGSILLIGGIIMGIIGMFLHEIWSIIGAYVAVTGIIFALVRKKKIFIILFSIMAVLIVITVLLLTL